MGYFTASAWRENAPQVLARLKEACTSRYFPRPGGVSLYVETYRPEQPRGGVVICHGYGESALKYRELTFYFLTAGYTVFIPEHRGHARSAPDNPATIHIDRFRQYADDFAAVASWAREEMAGMPLHLFSHSMGGAVGALVLEQEPALFDRAVLSSPMIAPYAGDKPAWLLRAVCAPPLLFGKGKKPILGRPSAPASFESSSCNTRARYDVYREECAADPAFTRRPGSWRWYYEALGVTRRLMKHADRIRVPLLIFEAALDRKVRNDVTDAFAAKVGVTPILMKGCKHELFTADDKSLGEYLDRIFAFFG